MLMKEMCIGAIHKIRSKTGGGRGIAYRDDM